MAATDREEEFGIWLLGIASGPDLTLLMARFLRSDTVSCFVAELVVAIPAVIIVVRDDGNLLAATTWSSSWSTSTAATAATTTSS